MACKQLTKPEFDALLEQNPNAEGYPTLEDCPCNPCTSPSDCSDGRYCCTNYYSYTHPPVRDAPAHSLDISTLNGLNQSLCLNRAWPDNGGCRIVFRSDMFGGDIYPGFKWRVEVTPWELYGGFQYTNEFPTPELASSYCGGQTYWNIQPIFGVNPCGFGYNCFFFYECMFE